MNIPETHDTAMERITAMLETAPDVAIPEDFAARVMAKLPPQRRTVLRAMPASSRYGQLALIVTMVLLVMGTLVLAPLTRGSALWLSLQVMLLLQLGAMVVLFGYARRHTL